MRSIATGGLIAVLLVTACATDSSGAAAAPSSTLSSTATTTTSATLSTSVASPSSAPSSATSTGTAESPTASTTPAITFATCVNRFLGTLSPTERAGQLLLVGVPAGSPLPAATQLAALHVGGIFLHGRVAGSRSLRLALAGAQQAARSARTLPLLVSADEEGGAVQTIAGGSVPPFPSALTQGGWSTTTLGRATTTWGGEIAALGVNLDLAPVADTVPASLGTANPPIGLYRREYGTTAATVSRAMKIVVPALRSAHVGPTVKHFPGLGRVRYNTDTSAKAVDSTTTVSDPYLQPFVDGLHAGAVAVMVSSARYPKLDARNPAMWSFAIVTGLLRQRLGWTGLVMSDDLGQAVAAASQPVGARATAFVGAGGDLVLTVQPSQAATMRAAIAAKAASSRQWRLRVDDAARHVIGAKIALGLIHC